MRLAILGLSAPGVAFDFLPSPASGFWRRTGKTVDVVVRSFYRLLISSRVMTETIREKEGIDIRYELMAAREQCGFHSE
jgi:hypothetical protein